MRRRETGGQAVSTADRRGGEGCPSEGDESYLTNVRRADEAHLPPAGHGGEKGAGVVTLGPGRCLSSLRSKDRGAGDTKATARERLITPSVSCWALITK